MNDIDKSLQSIFDFIEVQYDMLENNRFLPREGNNALHNKLLSFYSGVELNDNDDKSAINLRVRLIEKAEHGIDIVTGGNMNEVNVTELDQSIWIKPEVTQAISNAIGKKVKVRVIHRVEVPITNEKIINNPSVAFYTLPKLPKYHYVVVDRSYFRFESDHSSDASKNSPKNAKAKVYLGRSVQKTLAEISGEKNILSLQAESLSVAFEKLLDFAKRQHYTGILL